MVCVFLRNNVAKLKELKEILLGLPEEALDLSVREDIKQWEEVPTPLQILWLLDQCVMCSLATPMVIWALNHALSMSIVSTGTTYDAVVRLATWRRPEYAENEVECPAQEG